MSHCLVFALLSLLICHVAPLSLPETLNMTSSTTLLPNGRATCTPFKLLQLRPLHRDCDRAVNSLSSSSSTGHFHAGGAMDEWQLPVTETFGTCEVVVELLPFSLRESSCWAAIRAIARRLNEECRDTTVLSDVTGGKINAGPHGRILITVARKASVTDEADG